ncbi:MAG: ATP-binding protein, partial [Rhodothermales bacterium]
MGFLAAVWYFKRTQRLGPAVHVFVAVLFALLTQKAWLTGGFTLAGAASLTWLWACPILATVLLSTRSGIIWTIVTVGTYTAILVLTEYLGAVASAIPVESAASVFYSDMIGFGLALVVLGALFSRGKQQLLAAEQQRAWLASFPELSPEPTAEISRDGEITYLNPSIKSLFPDLEHRRASHPLFQGLSQDLPDHDIIGTASYVTEVEVGPRAFELRISSVPGGNLRVYAHDITDRVQYEAGLREAKERTEEMLRLKEAFVATMSHEIRTPLAGIIGSAEIIAEDLGSHNDFVTMILTSSRRLQSMLESVLELARLEANDVDLRPESIDVWQHVTEVVRSFRPRAEEKGIKMSIVPRLHTSGATFLTDGEILRTILHHLIDNAVKFTHVGSIRVNIEEERHGVRIQVEDTGIGIDPSFLPELYAPFKQASEGLGRTYEGSGLGLTVVRRLVDL